MCHTISETRGRGGKNVGSGILSFCPCPEKTGREIRAVRGGSKNLGILTFSIKGTPTESGPGSIPELCVRALKRTPGAPRARPEGRGVKFSKSNRGFFIKAKLKWTTPCFILVLKLFREMHPWGPRCPGKS